MDRARSEGRRAAGPEPRRRTPRVPLAPQRVYATDVGRAPGGGGSVGRPAERARDFGADLPRALDRRRRAEEQGRLRGRAVRRVLAEDGRKDLGRFRLLERRARAPRRIGDVFVRHRSPRPPTDRLDSPRGSVGGRSTSGRPLGRSERARRAAEPRLAPQSGVRTTNRRGRGRPVVRRVSSQRAANKLIGASFKSWGRSSRRRGSSDQLPRARARAGLWIDATRTVS